MTRYRIADGVLRAEVDGEEVLLNPETGIYHMINSTGRAILVSLQDGSTVDESVTAVARESGASEDRVSTDTHMFLKSLVDRDLIVEVL